jgi:hypothetical protein
MARAVCSKVQEANEVFSEQNGKKHLAPGEALNSCVMLSGIASSLHKGHAAAPHP